MFDLDDLADIGKDIVEGCAEAASTLSEKAIEVVKQEAPHIIHKGGEILSDIVKK